MARSENYTTSPFTLSFPWLIDPQPRKARPDGTMPPPNWNCVAVWGPEEGLDKADHPMRLLARGVLNEAWPNPKDRPKEFKLFRKCEEQWTQNDDGSLTPVKGYPAGGYWLALKSNEKPECVDQQTNLITQKKDLYAGAKCIAVISFYSYNFEGTNRGVSAGLQCLQKIRDVPQEERLDGRTSAKAAFKPVENLSVKNGAAAGGSSEEVFEDPI